MCDDRLSSAAAPLSRPAARSRLTTTVIALVALHSLLLGVLMLVATRLFLSGFGFPSDGPLFFPSQSGVFLLILGACYALAARDRGMAPVIVISKSGAVAFLLVHVIWLGAPPIIWGAALGDLAMLGLVLALLRVERRNQPEWVAGD